MTNLSAMGIIFANMHGHNVSQLVGHRTMASLPFGGRYRMIDFSLSGMSFAGIRNIGVVVSQNYQSLMDHLGNGREWDLSRKRGGLVIFPPGGRDSGKVYPSRVEALDHVMAYLTNRKEELVVLSDCDTACNFDYAELVRSHRATGADVTVVYERSGIPDGMLDDNITYELDGDNVVTDVRLNDYKKGGQNLSMHIYVINRELLINLIKDAMVHNLTQFERDILARNLKLLRVRGYQFTGYRARICDIASFFDQNLRLIKHENLQKLFPQERPVYTKVRDEAPVRYGFNAKVENCLVADGCIIEGNIKNCVLFRGVRVGKGANLKNCVIMQGGEIKQDAVLENVVADKDVLVEQGKMLRGAASLPVIIPKGSRVQ